MERNYQIIMATIGSLELIIGNLGFYIQENPWFVPVAWLGAGVVFISMMLLGFDKNLKKA